MKRNMYTETIKYYKKFKDRWYIQFLDDKAYISDGHMIIAMDKDEYTRYIIPKIVGVPQYTEDTRYSIKKGICIEIENKGMAYNFAEFFEQAFNDYSIIEAKVTKIVIDTEKAFARGIVWEKNGKTEGAIINEWFYDISREHSDGNYYASKKINPILTKGKVIANTGMLILPIHYTEYSTFGEILEGMNAIRTLAKQEYAA